MKLTFTYEELKRSKCQIVEQEICPDTFDDSELPTDVHIISYSVGGELYHDAIRSYTMVDIFDQYYDKLKDIGHVVKIRSGLGKIRPKSYGKINQDSSES